MATQGNIMTPDRRNWFESWRLLAVLTLVLTALSTWIAGMRGFEVDGVRMVIRFTARSSLLFFCLAFAASALALLWPASGTRWLRRNRRYLGLTFAASHAIHAVAIVCFAVMAPADYAVATTPASYIFGGIGYAFIIAMAVTSFDRTAATIGPRTWRILHTTGIYYLWFQFIVSFGMRIPQMPNYVWFLMPLIVVMVLRITAAILQRRRARVAVSAN
jgi:DMSO/TMAO reductase YedYZ heme-binding membrane subunit